MNETYFDEGQEPDVQQTEQPTDRYAELAAEIKRQNELTASVLQHVVQSHQPAQQEQRPQEEWEPEEQREARQLRNEFGQFKAETVADRAIARLERDNRLTEEERDWAIKAASQIPADKLVNQTPQSVVDFLAGQAKLNAPKPSASREPKAGPAAPTTIDPKYREFLHRAGYKMSDKDLVAQGFTRADDPLYLAFQSAGGR